LGHQTHHSEATYNLCSDFGQKIGDIRRVLYDQVSIINYRCNYLRKIKSFTEAGYDIVYQDETWVDQNHCTDYMWLPNDGSDAPKIPSGKGKRLIVLHAGTRSEGLIDGCVSFRKRFDLSQIITPIIDNRHLVVQNSSNITYFFISISKINES
jgi:hypothetical protein